MPIFAHFVPDNQLLPQHMVYSVYIIGLCVLTTKILNPVMEEKNMKRRMLSILLVALLLVASLPVTVIAASQHELAAGNIRLSNDKYHDNGSLKYITTTFDWGWKSENVSGARLILMKERLNGSKKTGDSLYGSDFSDVGKYFNDFANYSEVVAHDNSHGTFGIISSNGSNIAIEKNSQDNTASISIAEGSIPMDVDGTYYIYLWVNWSGSFYPDNLICVVQVENGELKYAPGDASDGLRNYYNPASFRKVGSFLVDVVPGTGMTITSGTTSQSVATGSVMTNVICTANTGYIFPAGYSVASVNNVSVTRLSDTQIQVSGIPTADAKIILPAATKGSPEPTHNCEKSDWMFDNNNHWKRTCRDANCPKNNYSIPANRGAHTFTNDYDTECNDNCGYTRTAPAEKPETGDITNITLWTMLVMGGMAALWMQLEQRKREQY